MSKLSKTSITPYCKVCHDAGKEEAIYLSHFIRETKDPSSKIVCPTLLSQQCRYCFKPGHTVKYCKEIKRLQFKKIQKEKKEKALLSVVALDNTHKSNNIYHALTFDEDDEEDNITEPEPEEDQAHKTPEPLSYKNIIEITKKQVLQEEIEKKQQDEKRKEDMQKRIEEAHKKTLEAKEAQSSPPVYIRKVCALNWADDTSSDEEDL